MIWLMCIGMFDAIAQFDPVTGQITHHSRTGLGNNLPSKFSGLFSSLSGVLAILYKHEGGLFVSIGGNAIPFDDDTQISVYGPITHRTIIVRQTDKEVIRHTYGLDESLFIPGEPAPPDDEDIDFGLLLSNMSNDRKRRQDWLEF